MKRMLRRPWKGRMICGVCAGIGARFGVDAMLVRLAFAALCLVHGLRIFAYVMALLLMSEEIHCWSAEEGIYEEYC